MNRPAGDFEFRFLGYWGDFQGDDVSGLDGGGPVQFLIHF
jgi:hypothetical protein